ncbi:MAG: methyl-accepting chemotaxis protein [Spirochaetales bacterium]|nr:methyl-accepting chemotaxis protein [Spirochaetales bacterium]
MKRANFVSQRLSFRISFYALLTTIIVMSIMVATTSSIVRKIDGENQKHLMLQTIGDLQKIIDAEITSTRNLIGGYSSDRNLIEALENPEVNGQRGQKVIDSLMATSQNFENTWITDKDGRIIISHNPEALGLDCSGNNFYRLLNARMSQNYMDLAPSPSPLTGHPIFVCARPILSEKGKFLGIIAVSYDFEIFSHTTITHLKYGREGYAFVLDQMGNVIAHPNDEIIFTDMSDNSAVKKVLQGADPNEPIWYEFEGETKLLFFNRLSSVPWIVAISLPKNDFYYMTNLVTLLLALSGLAASIFLVTSIIFMMKNLVIKRITALRGGIEILSTGDLTQSTDIAGKDELNYIGGSLKTLTTTMHTLIGSLVEETDALKQLGLTLTSNMEETSTSIIQIDSNIESTRKQISTQGIHVEETAALMEQMTQNIEELDEAIQTQVASVTESSSAIEEMIANISTISGASEKAESHAIQLTGASAEGRDNLSRVEELVKAISDRSQNLEEANSIIANIASQTNLLAMNAAIEAAHAGDAGKGFAVVSDEIRKLAEQSSLQSKQVKLDLKEITGLIHEMVTHSGITLTSFDKITDRVVEVNRIILEISSAMIEQNSGGREILTALQNMNEVTGTVERSSKEMSEGSHKVIGAVSALNQISAEVKNAIEEIRSGTREINQAVENVNELVHKNQDHIEIVVGHTQKFIL